MKQSVQTKAQLKYCGEQSKFFERPNKYHDLS